MTTPYPDLQWQAAPTAYRSSYLAQGHGQGVYVLVYNDPTWGVRFEPSPNERFVWLGQFTEKTGGKSRAVQRAQQHYHQILRRKAWEKYMAENDPPQTNLGDPDVGSNSDS